jgi:hypothetical protein
VSVAATPAGPATSAIEDPRGEIEDGRRGLPTMRFKRVEARERIVVEIEGTHIDQCVERLERQSAARDGVEQRCRNRMPADVAARRAGQRIAPPLQPHLAGECLVHPLRHDCDLTIERVERMQVRSPVGAREQAGKPAVVILLSNQAFAVRVIPAHPLVAAGHSTARSSAATRRRSPMRML